MNAPLFFTVSFKFPLWYSEVAESQARRRKGAQGDHSMNFLGCPVVTSPHWQAALIERHVAKTL